MLVKLFVTAILVSSTVFAKALEFKCRQSSSESAFDLKVDLKNKSFMIGQGGNECKIVGTSDDYIYASCFNLGSRSMESMILNRSTGEFARAMAGLFCFAESADSTKGCKDPKNFKLNTYTNEGVCSKKLL